MPTKRKGFTTTSNDEVALKGIEYFNKKTSIKELEIQCKECRKPLEEYLSSNGKTLPTGSLIAVLPYADVDVHLKKTLRVSKVLLPDAIEVLRENGFGECIEEVSTVREDVIERLYLEGKISDTLLKDIYQSKDTYAFSVELKTRMSDAPE